MKNIIFYCMLLKNIETLSYEEEMVRCAGTFYRNVIVMEHWIFKYLEFTRV